MNNANDNKETQEKENLTDIKVIVNNTVALGSWK